MKVGDKVKVDGFGGIYSSYADWAELIGAKRWTNNKYPKSMEFVIKEIAPHIDESITLYLLSNEEGDFIFDAVHSEITVKSRTRTEYEKVTESIFDLRDEFERGELYFDRDRCTGGIYASSDQYQKIRDMADFSQAALNNNIYRKAEKEIDWQDEVVHAYPSIDFKDLDSDGYRNLGSWRPDKFLELCRVALRANGDIE